MLENECSVNEWKIDWSLSTHKNWAEKERKAFAKAHKNEYELLSRKLSWFQKKKAQELIDKGDMERIGKDKTGHKINFRIYAQTVRILGSLTYDQKTFYPLLFLYKKTNRVEKVDLETFEDRLKNL